ncbi:argininosuccinate lyase [Paenibacillus protaetiae]|uniref:Argininosuccinate lyase n=1 Tax=Paenibacillus protaetiae TaxID=2509456 RepID=A0A4P6F018_9BACL|nr:argininosuccinate lyase [Paenibacillus protaetiae]QAY66327.1 argininosuccinate lyase [Paenibacillus protaetiae]
MGIKQAIFEREGSSFPGATYSEVVLAPAYEQAKSVLLHPMLAIHKAHLIMLVEQSLLSREQAAAIVQAIRSLNPAAITQTTYDGHYEDLFFLVESQIMQRAGEIGGSLHLARSRNDMGVAMYRLTLRDKLLVTITSAVSFLHTLLDTADNHTNTVMLGYTHTQQAQPMTFAHYITAVFDSVSRDVKRLTAAYDTNNASPLGAAALTTSGFPISRQRVADLLAFDRLVENSYDAIGGADYLGETASALKLSFIGIGRFVQDLLLWSTQEFAAIRVADPYVQISSIMPQKRNPVSLEHIRSLSSSGVGSASTVLQMLHNTPFGDIVDTEDDLQPHLWQSLHLSDQLFRLFAAVIGTLEVNKEVLLERAKRSFASITELADSLVREKQIPFRSAHSIASGVVKLALSRGLDATQVTSTLIDEVAEPIIGAPLYLPAEIVSRAMDPVHFVEIRKLTGGPSPAEVSRALAARRLKLQEIQSWLDTQKTQISRAYAELDEITDAWL